jgi:hypothetical protein
MPEAMQVLATCVHKHNEYFIHEYYFESKQFCAVREALSSVYRSMEVPNETTAMTSHIK